MTTEEEVKRQKQSKALGAAFLAHQVQELEKSIDTLTFSRSGGRGPARGGTDGGAAKRGGAARHSREGPTKTGLKPIRIVDASTLVHALPVLKRWVREDQFQLVVPLSALATLDILKKAPPPLHDLARDATRFLETQLNIARQIQSAWSGAEADSRIRLRAQRNTEELPWARVEQLFTVPKGYKVELPRDENGQPIEIPLEEGQEEPEPLPFPTADDIPRSLRSTLQCILHFCTPKLASPSPSVAIYNSLLETPPPIPSSLLSLVPPTSSRKASSIDFLALSSGDALDYYLSTFFSNTLNQTGQSSLPQGEFEEAKGGGGGGGGETRSEIVVVSSSEVVAATQWLKRQAQSQQAAKEKSNGNVSPRGGSGRGRGDGRGRGNGRGGKSETGGRGGGGGGTGNSQVPSKTLFVP